MCTYLSTHAQVDLYNKYLSDEVKVLSNYDGTDTNTQLRLRILPDSHIFARITAHPYMLLLHKKKMDIKQCKEQERADMADFIADDDTDTDMSTDDDGNVVPHTKRTRRAGGDGGESDDGTGSGRSTPDAFRSNDWWTTTNMVTETDENVVDEGGKFVILFELLKKCEQIGDKCLIFSQRTEVLDFIEHLLKHFDRNRREWFTGDERPAGEAPSLDGGNWGWRKGADYERMDGSTSTADRTRIINKFNDADELRTRMMLISTKAGGVGITLTAANRVILFDVNWNPANDQQSLFSCLSIWPIEAGVYLSTGGAGESRRAHTHAHYVCVCAGLHGRTYL